MSERHPSPTETRTATTADVLVVGLGPAGASAARAAAKAGARVIGVDRRLEPGLPVQCAEFVPRSLGSEVEGLSRFVVQPIEAMESFVERDAPRRDPLPGFIVDRARFDAGLVEAARAAGADCRFAATVASIDEDGLRLADGSLLRAPVIIGADGPLSRVGRAVGVVNRVLSHTRQVTVPLKRPHDATDIFLSTRIPGGYGWLFPKGEVANLGVGIDAAFRGDLTTLLDELRASLIEEGRIGPATSALTGGAIPAGGLLAPTAGLGGATILLAGDACGLANPVTGAGIASAVISGRMAGEAAAAVLAGETDAATDYAEEIEALFGPALARAAHRHEEILAACRAGRAGTVDLRRSWIAFDPYWAPWPVAPDLTASEGVAA